MARKEFKASSREEAIERLLRSYQVYYNIIQDDDRPEELVARFEFFEHSERYVLSQKAELWSSDGEEFLYLINIPHLTLPLFEKWRDFTHEDGMGRLNIGSGHMYSFITPVFVCDTCDEDALKALKKCHIYKSFHFSLHGWMDYHAAVVEIKTGRISSNRSGHTTAKVLKSVLYG